MELTQLRYFLQVYHTGNICTAALQISVTQQAISRQIQNLENEMGVTLFERTARGVHPTVYADLLAEKLQRFLPELDALVYDIKSRDKAISGVVRLGVQCWQMSAMHGLWYGALREFEQTHPRVRMLWENSTPLRCLEGLRSQELDLAVMCMPENPEDFELIPLCQAPWYMLMSRHHPLANRTALTVEDLAGQRLILAENERETRNRICQKLNGLEKPVFIGVNDFIFDLIGQQIEGENAMMLATRVVLDMFNPERFTMVPLASDFWRTQLYLARLSNCAHSPAAQALHRYLLTNWSD